MVRGRGHRFFYGNPSMLYGFTISGVIASLAKSLMLFSYSGELFRQVNLRSPSPLGIWGKNPVTDPFFATEHRTGIQRYLVTTLIMEPPRPMELVHHSPFSDPMHMLLRVRYANFRVVLHVADYLSITI